MGVYISSQLIKDGSVEGKDLKDATITESKLDAALAAKVNATGATVSANVTAANEAADTTCFPLFVTAPTGDLGPKTNAGLAFNSATGVLTATGLSGPLTGNVTGNTSGSSGSCTGNAATVTNGVYTTGAGTVFLAPTGSAAGLTGFPTLNQSTSGNAATATNLAGTATANTVYGGPATGAAAAPGFRALVAADLGTTMTPTFGGITTGTETTVANKNKYLPLISDSAGIQLRHQTYYWNGSSYAATDGYGFGNSALQNNTGDSCSGFGINALFGNAGSLSNGFGYNALYTNTGAGCNGFGYYALFGNTGTNCNGFGSDALNSNTGSYCNGFGVSALSNNTGAFSNGFGYAALSNNTGTNCNGFGTEPV